MKGRKHATRNGGRTRFTLNFSWADVCFWGNQHGRLSYCPLFHPEPSVKLRNSVSSKIIAPLANLASVVVEQESRRKQDVHNKISLCNWRGIFLTWANFNFPSKHAKLWTVWYVFHSFTSTPSAPDIDDGDNTVHFEWKADRTENCTKTRTRGFCLSYNSFNGKRGVMWS